MKIIPKPALKAGDYISCDLEGDGKFTTYRIWSVSKNSFRGVKVTPAAKIVAFVNFTRGPGKHVFGMFDHPKMLAYQYVPEWKDKLEQEEKQQ